MKKSEYGSNRTEGEDGCLCADCRLPADGSPVWLRDKAVPIWSGNYFADLAEDLGTYAAQECALAFGHGFEKGIVMAMLRPEWAHALYLKLREYYLTTHTADDLLIWEEHAEATASAIAIHWPPLSNADDEPA